MEKKLQPGSVVKCHPSLSSLETFGFVQSHREGPLGTVYLIRWSDAAESECARNEVLRPEALPVLAGDPLLYALDMQVQEVDMTAELMKVNVFPGKPSLWIDVRLIAQSKEFVVAAAQAREQWLEADRQKLDWFKPGQIVTNRDGGSTLARPATVIRQVMADRVELITSNGVANVLFEELVLHSNSIQDLQAKQAQRAVEAMDRFKDEVRAKAMEAAEEHGWCSEVKEMLTELGIKTKVPKVRVTLQLTVEVDVEVHKLEAMDKLDMNRSMNRDWWLQTVKFEDDGRDLQLQDDGDLNMDSAVVRLSTAEIIGIQDESYLEGED